MNYGPQLITYPDSLGGDLAALKGLLQRHLAGVFGGVHILPPFPSSGDRGFAPVTYYEIAPEFGTWQDMAAIGKRFDLMVDLMVNHISRHSPEFQHFLKHGRSSPHAGLFITLDKVWPGGEPPDADIAKIFLRRPASPFSAITIQDTGETERIWTTFGQKEQTEQIDLDVRTPVTRKLLVDLLRFFRERKIRIVRLDAVGYVIKKAGTSCFMVEPDVYEFLDWLTGQADALGLTLLPEVHAEPPVQRRLADRGYWVYDFVLPLLVLHAFVTASGGKLAAHLKTSPRHQFTMLDCHDGIPVQPDLNGILTVEEMQAVVDHCLARGANLSRLMTRTDEPLLGFDAHQVNITYYSALDAGDAAYLAARTIQLFAPGIPQIYYVGLLAGENDHAAVAATGEKRAINRHNYTVREVEAAMAKPAVQQLLELIRLRNTHPAFQGRLAVDARADHELVLEWRQDDDFARLEVNLATKRIEVWKSG